MPAAPAVGTTDPMVGPGVGGGEHEATSIRPDGPVHADGRIDRRMAHAPPGHGPSMKPKNHAIVLALGLGALLPSCAGGDDPETIVEEAQEEGFEELLVDEPFEGTAIVEDVLSPNAFRLLDTLVVTAEPVELVEGELVEVVGVVRDDLDAVAEELATDLDEASDAHDGGLFVVAISVEEAR